MTYTVATPNVLLDLNEDKHGHIMHELKRALVATGLWRVRGSGDGSTFQLMGQTAGIGGSFDVFTAAQPWVLTGNWYGGGAGTFSRINVWYVLEEIASGRCLTWQRWNNAGYPRQAIVLWSHGVAQAGASANVPPAVIAPSNQLSNGDLGGTIDYASNYYWMHVGASDQLMGNGKVAPFYFFVVNRNGGSHTLGMVYESLVDTVEGDQHPYILSWSVGNAFSNPQGNASWIGGANAAVRTLGMHGIYNFTYPSSTYQPLGKDGKWRTMRPLVADANLAMVGRCENLMWHMVARNYPTTYDVSTPNAKVVIGYLMMPWAQGVVPGFTP